MGTQDLASMTHAIEWTSLCVGKLAAPQKQLSAHHLQISSNQREQRCGQKWMWTSNNGTLCLCSTSEKGTTASNDEAKQR